MNTQQVIEVRVDQQYTVTELVPDQLDLLVEISVIPASSIAYLENLKEDTESARETAVTASNDSYVSASWSDQRADASDLSAGESFQSAQEARQNAQDSLQSQEISEQSASEARVERQVAEEAATASAASAAESLSSEQVSVASEAASIAARSAAVLAQQAAEASQQSAAAHQVASELARDNSITAQDGSEVAQAASEAASTQSSVSATASAHSASASAGSAVESLGYSSDSQQSSFDSADSAAASQTSRLASAAARDDSEAAQVASELSRLASESAQQQSERARDSADQSSVASDVARQASVDAQQGSETAERGSIEAQLKAEQAQGASELSRDHSADSAALSAASADVSTASKQASEVAQEQAEQARFASETAQAASELAQNSAELSETGASESADSASSSQTASASSASASESSRVASGHSATASESSRQASDLASAKAQKWADNPYESPVETTKYSARHWSETAKRYSDSLTNGMFFAGSWDAADGLPPTPTGNLVPWYRIVSDSTINSISYSTVTPGDQLCWDPENLEWFIIDTTDQVTSVNGQVGQIALDAGDVEARPDNWVPSWSQLTGKPATFPATAHDHPWSEVTGKPSQSTRWPAWNEVTSKPTAFNPVEHVHPWSEVTGKPSTFTPASHEHDWDQLNKVPATATRWPSWSEVSSKPSTFTPSSHTHPWSNITGAPATATRWPQWGEITGSPDEFPPADHTHAWAQVSGKPTQATRWPAWNEVTSKPSTFAPSSHNHPVSEVSGLQTELNKKATITGVSSGGDIDFDLSVSANRNVKFRMLEENKNHGFYIHYDGAGSNLTRLGTRGSGVDTDFLSVTRSSASVTFKGDIYKGNDRIFHDRYHPNADKWTTARTLSLGGDASGSVSIDGSANKTLTVSVNDDSHNHVISNVDGLQTALDGKLGTGSKAADSDKLDGLHYSSFVRSDADDTMNSHLTFVDGKTLQFGNDGDFRIWHDGTSNYFRSYRHGASTYFQGESSGGTNRNLIIARPDSSVELYYAGSQKLHTTSTGANVLGECQADGFNADNSKGYRFNDVNQYILYTSSNWGLYWDTSSNKFQFHGGGTNYASIDLDNGNFWTRGTISADGITSDADFRVKATAYFEGVTVYQTAATEYNSSYLPTHATGTKSYLRKFRGGNSDSIWHETIQGGIYRLATGNSDTTEQFSINGQNGYLGGYKIYHAGNKPSKSDVGLSALDNAKQLRTVSKNGYYGMVDGDGYDNSWIRTTQTGIIPYQPDGYSSLGTESWPFNDAYINSLHIGSMISGKVNIVRDAGSSTIYDNGHLELRNGDAGDVSMGFHRAGYTACQLRHESSGLILSGTSRTGAADFQVTGSIRANGSNKVWHAGNDGGGSGLDADMLDGLHASSFLRSDANDSLSGNITFNGDVEITNSSWNDNSFVLSGPSPSIKFRDLDTSAGWCQLGLNSGSLFVLSDLNMDGTYDGIEPFRLFLSTGNALFRGNVTAYSDRRLKSNIQPISNALDKVCQLSGNTFHRDDLGIEQAGVIAQDLQEILPESVIEGHDGMLAVSQAGVVALLVEAVKELRHRL